MDLMPATQSSWAAVSRFFSVLCLLIAWVKPGHKRLCFTQLSFGALTGSGPYPLLLPSAPTASTRFTHKHKQYKKGEHKRFLAVVPAFPRAYDYYDYLFNIFIKLKLGMSRNLDAWLSSMARIQLSSGIALGPTTVLLSNSRGDE